MKVSKINIGIYKITIDNRVFQAEKNYYGQWNLLESVDYSYLGLSNEMEYFDTFLTLGCCKIAAQDISKENN
jgi:hypothetical protein